jgi:hypothetical protein
MGDHQIQVAVLYLQFMQLTTDFTDISIIQWLVGHVEPLAASDVLLE